MSIKPFAKRGHYTEVHDAVFDEVMPICPPNAWKILCLVIRKTLGWQKDEDRLSYSQIRKGTGISSDATVRSGLAWLTHPSRRLLNAETKKDSAGRQLAILYSLNLDFEIEEPSTENECPSTEIVEPPSTEIEDSPTTETVETITTPQYPHSDNQRDGGEPPIQIHSKIIEDCLDLLSLLAGYPKDRKRNGEQLEKKWREYPGLDLREEVGKFCDYYVDGFGKNGRPRGRLATWLSNADRWAREGGQGSDQRSRARPWRRHEAVVHQDVPEECYDGGF